MPGSLADLVVDLRKSILAAGHQLAACGTENDEHLPELSVHVAVGIQHLEPAEAQTQGGHRAGSGAGHRGPGRRKCRELQSPNAPLMHCLLCRAGQALGDFSCLTPH